MPADCPDGRCDGSGFLYDEERRRARPCTCRPQRIARKRAAAVAGRLPKRFRGVSFDREPVTSMNHALIREVQQYVRGIGERLDEGRGITPASLRALRRAIRRGRQLHGRARRMDSS